MHKKCLQKGYTFSTRKVDKDIYIFWFLFSYKLSYNLFLYTIQTRKTQFMNNIFIIKKPC